MKGIRRSGIELLEESVDLLRRAPASAWVWYLGGAGPFFGAVLIFWWRMTGLTAAPDPLPGAFLLAVLFGWRQYTRSYFGGELYRLLSGSERAPHRATALAASWCAGILRMPLLVIPFPAVVALFRNVSVLASRAENPKAAFSQAGALATRGGEQLPALLTVLGASLIVWINVFTGMIALPLLFQMFSGENTVFSRSPQALINGTLGMSSVMVTWYLLDVLLTAFYALRVFYGESEETGADLLGSWRRAVAKAAAVAVMLWCGMALRPAVLRADTPAELNHAIDQVLKEAPYQWRQPPPRATEQNAFVRWTDNILRSIRGFFTSVQRAWAEFLNWLRNLANQPGKKSNTPPPDVALKAISWIVIVVLAGALITLLLRSKLLSVRRHVRALPVGPVAIDLEDPSVLASQLPENEWIAMARDFMLLGDYRMALRAYFLASLAFLASRELVAIGRAKTNLDYLRELRRRARSVNGLDQLFAGGIQSFESAWYGLHEVGDSEVNRFAANFEHMRSLLTA